MVKDFPEVRQICGRHAIEITDLSSVTGSFAKQIFFINHEFLLRLSQTSMALEQEKFRRVAALDCVPKIIHAGILQREAGPLHYTLLTLLPGDDFVNRYPATTSAQQKLLGQEIAAFLDRLHELSGPYYDIGLYVPALPNFSGTWREGHQQYWQRLEKTCETLPLTPESSRVIASAFGYLRSASAVLDFQRGPKLLHNDFHPKNMLLAGGRFSGVIDWECSQFGEADFELCHLIHWCLYPPGPAIDFRPFLQALFEAAPQCTRIPQLAQRLTLYQIEHKIQQILWNPGAAQAWRVPRLVRWMDGDVDALLAEITA